MIRRNQNGFIILYFLIYNSFATLDSVRIKDCLEKENAGVENGEEVRI
jgi:hypothetical protein